MLTNANFFRTFRRPSGCAAAAGQADRAGGAGCAPDHASPPAWSVDTPAHRVSGRGHRRAGAASCRPRSGRRAGRYSAPRGRRSAAMDRPRPRRHGRVCRLPGSRCTGGALGPPRCRPSDTPVFTRHRFTVSTRPVSTESGRPAPRFSPSWMSPAAGTLAGVLPWGCRWHARYAQPAKPPMFTRHRFTGSGRPAGPAHPRYWDRKAARAAASAGLSSPASAAARRRCSKRSGSAAWNAASVAVGSARK